jgi:hypothetical protein
VDHVQNEEKVEPGEMFYTSGDDRVFPKGMPAGRVTVVRPGTTFKEIYLVPSGFQQGLEEVLIVIEGVHGQIPDSQTASAPGVYLMPPVDGSKAATPAPAASAGTPALATEADHLREKYKRIGEAQGHTYGQPTGRVPNFNLNPGATRPSAPGATGSAPTPPGPQQAISGAVPPSQNPRPASPAGVPPSGAGSQQSTAVPQQTGTSSSGSRQTPAPGTSGQTAVTVPPQAVRSAATPSPAQGTTGGAQQPGRELPATPQRDPTTDTVRRVPESQSGAPGRREEQRPLRPPQ